MELQNISVLKADAARALRRGREPRDVVIWYGGGTVVIALVLTLLNYWLSYEISQTGGLGNMGVRTMLSTAQAIVPIAQSVLLSCLELGYLYAMLRIGRGQYADRTDLKEGFRRLFPLVRLSLLQSALYCLLAFLTYQLAAAIYMVTPWADSLGELVTPLVGSGSLNVDALLSDAFLGQAMPLLVPMFVIWAIACCVVMIPVSFRLRMASFCLLDDARGGALRAMRTSIRIMKGKCLWLFKLDLNFWWYYLALVLAGVLAYLDVILSAAGVVLPLPADAVSLIVYGISLAALFACYYFLRNQVQSTYVMAYESICDRPQESGVVLGNIFDMQ